LFNIVTRVRAGRPRFDSWHGHGFFSLRHRVHTASGAHLASYSMGTGSGAEIKSDWSYNFTPQYAFMERYLVITRATLPLLYCNKLLYVCVCQWRFPLIAYTNANWEICIINDWYKKRT